MTVLVRSIQAALNWARTAIKKDNLWELNANSVYHF